MTSLLDKSTPVPVVDGFLSLDLTPKAHACRGKSFKENHLHNAGTGGREVGNPKSGLIQDRYISGVNRNHTVSRYRYFLKGKCSPNEHGLTIASGKLKIAQHMSIQSFSQPEKLVPKQLARTRYPKHSYINRSSHKSLLVYRIKQQLPFRTPLLSGRCSMTKSFTEHFHHRINWPLVSWQLPDHGSTFTEHLQPPGHQVFGKSAWAQHFTSLHFQELIL